MAKPKSKKKKKILIIEDELALVNNLELLLEDRYEIEAVGSGDAGFRTAKKIKPDLILLDILLPDINGIELLKQFKSDSDTDDIPIIVLTNLADPETISDILKQGGTDYLVKADYKLEEVSAKIDSVL